MNQRQSPTGKVFLVGAGPGDPGLITVRGLECLEQADLVLYDYLVNPLILQHARRGIELICLGRHGRGRIWTQDEINQQMIQAAQAGQCVVRLKGGDPAIFACGAQEIGVLREAGVSFEVVPGITTALAAGSYAGVPVTHRDVASAVALITGQEDLEKNESIDYASLAKFPGTLVMYMGVTTAPTWTSALIEAGKPSDTPAAIVRRCSFPDQEIIRCNLSEVAELLVSPQRIRPPVVVIVGAVASLSQNWSWFDRRPLFGNRILVTRPADQAAELQKKLADLGAEVLTQPAIEVSEPDDWSPVDRAIERLSNFDWLVFSSCNGVSFFMDRLYQLGLDVRIIGGLQLAAIGPRTVEALRSYGLVANVQPSRFCADDLAHTLSVGARGKRFLLARASRGREVLAQELKQAGAEVTQVVTYQSRDVESADPDVTAALEAGTIDWVTVTSSAIARSLVSLFGRDLQKTRIASISPVTSSTLRELGVSVDAEAQQYTMEGLVEALRSTLKDR
jgi:uroporphyrinogen III methyltransferase/synthase